MIFNRFAYFIFFLLPAAVLFRLVTPAVRPWICVTFGAGFFGFFALTEFNSYLGAACLLIFLWGSLFSRLYRRARSTASSASSRPCSSWASSSIGIFSPG